MAHPRGSLRPLLPNFLRWLSRARRSFWRRRFARPGVEAARPQWVARWHEWRGDRRVAAALFACVAVAAAVAWFRAGAGGGSSSALPPPAATSATSDTFAPGPTTTRAAPTIVVDVVGAVRRAAVVRLRGGARVIDAINAAGGATADADLTRLNLAAALVDGSRVAVPRARARPRRESTRPQ